MNDTDRLDIIMTMLSDLRMYASQNQAMARRDAIDEQKRDLKAKAQVRLVVNTEYLAKIDDMMAQIRLLDANE